MSNNTILNTTHFSCLNLKICRVNIAILTFEYYIFVTSSSIRLTWIFRDCSIFMAMNWWWWQGDWRLGEGITLLILTQGTRAINVLVVVNGMGLCSISGIMQHHVKSIILFFDGGGGGGVVVVPVGFKCIPQRDHSWFYVHSNLWGNELFHFLSKTSWEINIVPKYISPVYTVLCNIFIIFEEKGYWQHNWKRCCRRMCLLVVFALLPVWREAHISATHTAVRRSYDLMTYYPEVHFGRPFPGK